MLCFGDFKGQMLLWEGSCILQSLTVPAPIWSLTLPEVDWRESYCYFRMCVQNNIINIMFLYVRYETWDHVGVLCDNLNETVEEALRLLDISPDTYFSLHSDKEDGTPISTSLPPPFPPCNLRTALKRYACLLSSPKKVGWLASHLIIIQKSICIHARLLAVRFSCFGCSCI